MKLLAWGAGLGSACDTSGRSCRSRPVGRQVDRLALPLPTTLHSEHRAGGRQAGSRGQQKGGEARECL